MIIQLLHPFLLALLLMAIGGALLYFYWLYKPVYYKYPLGSFIKELSIPSSSGPYWLGVLRIVVLTLLAVVIARPQLIDSSQRLKVDGIDIMLVLDVSGSMQVLDDLNDPRMRIEVAKEEAIKFIQQRKHDQIGLVLFGKQVFSRCPLTLDKTILTTIINDTKLGIIDGEGTLLACGMLTAVNRLKQSQARSKIMIVLTDGQPTPDDISPTEVVEIAKKFGIKIYTIGIGNAKESYIHHQLFGLMPVETPLNQQLLEEIAEPTGGNFFLASNSKELRTIYQKIDALEKSEHEETIFYKHQDFFKPLLWMVLIFLIIELILASSVWFIV